MRLYNRIGMLEQIALLALLNLAEHVRMSMDIPQNFTKRFRRNLVDINAHDDKGTLT